MRWTGFFFGMLLGVSFTLERGWCSSPIQKPISRVSAHLEFSSGYQQSQDPLTTDLLGQIDPTHKNPHLEVWGLKRVTELKGLKAIELRDQTYGVIAQGVVSQIQGYLRSPGPWYQTLNQFSCAEEVNSWFSTQEGAARAAAYAAEQWSQHLSQELQTLSSLFSRVKVQSASTAEVRGEMIFQGWLEKLEARWRIEAYRDARKEEWKSYLKEAKSAGICPRAQNMKATETPSRLSRMEPLSGSPPQWNQLLARVPARLWNGLFSVRMNVNLGEKKLNGRFLIDSTAPRSVISPLWLESQGVYPTWYLNPEALPERVMWSGLWNDQRPLSRWVKVDQVELSGLKLPLNQFLLAETEFFAPPENLGSCCDGVLGLDFLRLYPMEFQSQAPAEVRVWPRDKFLWSADTPWFELSESQDGSLVSACEWVSSAEKKTKSSPVHFPGVRWDLGLEEVAQVHTPWQSQLRSSSLSLGLSLQCDSVTLAQAVQPESPQPPAGIQASGPLAQSDPSVSVGMGLLGQSVFTIDLPHGRIWFKSKDLPLKLRQKDSSGLMLRFEQNDGERVLRVEQVKPRSPAVRLSQAGLQKDALILELNSTPVDELDLWQVEQILLGAHGKQVQLKWKKKRQVKEGILQLP